MRNFTPHEICFVSSQLPSGSWVLPPEGVVPRVELDVRGAGVVDGVPVVATRVVRVVDLPPRGSEFLVLLRLLALRGVISLSLGTS